MTHTKLSRRLVVGSLAAAALSSPWLVSSVAAAATATVWKDPNCGCCGGWVAHLTAGGFDVHVIETAEVAAIKVTRKVPDDLVSCHTAEISGYTIEGHVPLPAIRRLLAERPKALGLAVAGMPPGSPGMEADVAEPYDVILFADGRRSVFGRFVGTKESEG